MRSDRLKELRRLAEEICWLERLSGTEGNKKARRVIKAYLKEKGIPFRTESFEVEKTLPVSGVLRANGKKYEALPLIGSLWGEVSGELKVVRNLSESSQDLRGKVVAVPVGGMRDSEKAEILRGKKASALLTFLEEADVPFSGTLNGVKFPAASTKKSTVRELEGKRVILEIRTERKRIKGENIVVEFGRGPFVCLLAHYDTKPFVYGAVDNGLSVAFLLVLLADLFEYEDIPFRIRGVFTDCEEIGLEGSRYHARDTKNVMYAISIDGIGWKNPAVLYKDYHGENGRLINEKFFKHLNDMKVDIPFTESKTGSSDHVPFKEKGVETLFLSSNPFTLRHTPLDDVYAIDWEVVKLWYEVVSVFLRRIHRL
ncbi:MAG: M28 family peptidase [Aquificae bacterium]|nr:M28 family peptidase [Aquificota bacterium]